MMYDDDLRDCATCGLLYVRGVDTAYHRQRHRAWVRYLRPVVVRRLAGQDERVTVHSPRWKHRVLYEFARRFRREFQYDFVQWGDPDDDPRGQGFLFRIAPDTVVGGGAFRWREWTDAPSGWALQWVYIVPPWRRQGILSAQWPGFVARFGMFHVESPLSDAMEGFLRARGALEMAGPAAGA